MTTGHILLAISICLIAGLISNRLIKLVKLPNVTAYLIVGILLGPYLFSLFSDKLPGVISKEMVDGLGIIVDIALGFIAFSIGSEFKLSSIKKLGKGIIVITLFQSCMALVLVDLALLGFSFINGNVQENLPVILVLGAVATATAPAATLMVIKQYKARGPLTETLLPVVAFDDAVGLILFSLSFSFAMVFAKQNAGIDGATINMYNLICVPLIEIAISLAIGFTIGLLLTFGIRFFKSRANRLMCMIACVFLGVALCNLFKTWFELEISSLLTCMMIGAVFCNIRNDALVILDGIERWTPPIFMLFFILSGAELDFSVMKDVILICCVYLAARSVGKYVGAYIGCSISKTDSNVRKYLGLTLLPQAGVAIGMARSSSNSFRTLAETINYSTNGYSYLLSIGSTITAVVLCATLVYELFGPVITKISLIKAGEIKKETN